MYPDVSGTAQRGGLLQRWETASILGCELVKVPAEFIKNHAEVKQTGLGLGSILTEESIPLLYDESRELPEEVRYVLHTEPSLSHRYRFGSSFKPSLKWHDKDWVNRFVDMTISLSRFLGAPASIVEIHPGDKRNSFENIASAARSLLDRYSEEFKMEPVVLVGNSISQCVSSGGDMDQFWNLVCENYPELRSSMGITLDVPQLYAATQESFLEELDQIPTECLKGFQIYSGRHTKVPSLSDPIPWIHVFGKILSLTGQIAITPEIRHRKKVQDVLEFCERMIRLA